MKCSCASKAAGVKRALRGGQCTAIDLLGSVADPLRGSPIRCRAAGIPRRDAQFQHTLNGAAAKGRQQLVLQFVFPEDVQEVESLLGLPDDDGGVGSPGEVPGDVHGQEPGISDPVHIDPIDG